MIIKIAINWETASSNASYNSLYGIYRELEKGNNKIIIDKKIGG